MKPVKETLVKMDAQLKDLEVTRHGAYTELMKAVPCRTRHNKNVRADTSQLLRWLRSPTTRGRWGEIQVQRILEMTGMSEYTKRFFGAASRPGWRHHRRTAPGLCHAIARRTWCRNRQRKFP